MANGRLRIGHIGPGQYSLSADHGTYALNGQAAALAYDTPGEALFFDDFSSGDLSHSENGIGWGATRNTSVQASPNGTPAIRFRFDASSGGSSSAEQRFTLPSLTEVWFTYKLYIPANYYHTPPAPGNNNKGWLYLWSGAYDNNNGVQTGPGLGPNWWPNGDGTSNATFFWWTGPNQTGQHLDNSSELSGGTHLTRSRAIEEVDYGHWHDIYCHYKYATSANNNGVAEIWKTNHLGETIKIIEVLNGPWYQAGQPGFQNGYLLGAANTTFDPDTDFYIDDVEVATTDIWGIST